MDASTDCPLCRPDIGHLVWEDPHWRVIRAAEADFPAFYRVVARAHVAEFSQLEPLQRIRCMALVCALERTLIERLAPTKINLAALGNMVPHLHWHVIARFDWDSHFPQAVWGARQRDIIPGAVQRLVVSLDELDAAVAAALRAA